MHARGLYGVRPQLQQAGDHLVVRGEGVPRLDGRGRGDLITLVNVDVPQKLSTKARQLLLELQTTFEQEA